jgi:hypothetical protein
MSTGAGNLQQTKPVITADFAGKATPPGYYSVYVGNVATAATHTLASIPDGMIAEIVDFGITVGNQAVVSTNGASESTLSFNILEGTSAAVTFMAAADISAGATTAAVGATLSALRGSTGYTFAAASTALSNQYGSGGVIQANIADADGTTGATGACTVWVRLKWISTDHGLV